MNLLLPTKPLPFNDYCKKCNAKTQHYLKLLLYNAIYHEINLMTWCDVCYKKEGDDVMCITATVTTKEWAEMLKDSTHDGEN